MFASLQQPSHVGVVGPDVTVEVPISHRGVKVLAQGFSLEGDSFGQEGVAVGEPADGLDEPPFGWCQQRWHDHLRTFLVHGISIICQWYWAAKSVPDRRINLTHYIERVYGLREALVWELLWLPVATP